MLEYNIIVARLLNKPTTLAILGHIDIHDPEYVRKVLNEIKHNGETVWGGAYLVSTHGMSMDKIDYLCDCVLGSVYAQYDAVQRACGWPLGGGRPSLKAAHTALQAVEGLASFMAAQVVADLKNTRGHPLQDAEDWRTFVAYGPGSLRGVSWFMYGTAAHISKATFQADIREIREYVESYIPWVADICNQDLQNCLCEYDKYMRVSRGVGRSKRIYYGR